jgi:membrane protein involved in colicin uptake
VNLFAPPANNVMTINVGGTCKNNVSQLSEDQSSILSAGYITKVAAKARAAAEATTKAKMEAQLKALQSENEALRLIDQPAEPSRYIQDTIVAKAKAAAEAEMKAKLEAQMKALQSENEALKRKNAAEAAAAATQETSLMSAQQNTINNNCCPFFVDWSFSWETNQRKKGKFHSIVRSHFVMEHQFIT